MEPAPGGIAIRVEGDGVGFDLQATLEGPATGRSIGFLGMRERARMLGGELRLDSSPGQGSRVRLRLPVDERA